MCVRLSKHTPDRIDFAHVVAHELAHTRGAGHGIMRNNSQYRRVGSYRTIYAWGEQLPLEVKPKRVASKPTPDAKLAHVQKMLKAALTREKRATTLRKKWEAKQKYYLKKATATAA